MTRAAEMKTTWLTTSRHRVTVPVGGSRNWTREELAEAKRRLSRYRATPEAGEPFPDELRGLPCGAQTRAGTMCKRTDIYANGRCKLHGGLSTGPRTAAGISRVTANLPRRAKRSAGGESAP
jgi:hypothetical protein